MAVGKLDIVGTFGVGLIEITFIFTFVELFDTFGTLVGTANRAGLLKNKAEGENKLGKAMLVDATGVSAGVLMMSQVKEIEWDDMMQAFPAFLTIILMPFTSSIANGISAGILAYTVLGTINNMFNSKKVSVHWLMWILSVLIVIRYAFMGGE